MASLQSFNIFSLNVGMSHSLAGLHKIISSENLDLIFLQEVSLTSNQIENQLPGFKAAVNVDTDDHLVPGTAIIWRNTLPVEQICSFVPCRIQTASLGPYRLINIYGPSGSGNRAERAIFYGQKVFQALNLSDNNMPFICGGDFNCLLKPIDVENEVGFGQKKCPALQDLVDAYQLLDTFRTCYSERKEFTFFRQGSAPSRLDRIYVSHSLKDLIIDSCHVASLSDHCGVKLIINLDVQPCKSPKFNEKSYWKLNTAILGDDNFLPMFNMFWKQLLKDVDGFPDISQWWDEKAKPEIKNFCVMFSMNRKKFRSQKKQFLLSYLKVALDSKNWEEIARVREQLDLLIKEDAWGFVVRSRFQQNAESERASLFHAGKEQKNAKNSLFSLRVQDRVITDQGEIENEVVNFFGALFNGHHDTSLTNRGSPFIPDNGHLDEMLQDLGCSLS